MNPNKNQCIFVLTPIFAEISLILYDFQNLILGTKG